MALVLKPLPRAQMPQVCIKPSMVRRYAAYAFDWTLVGLLVEVLPIESVLAYAAALVALGAIYFAVSEASSYQATLGKWAVGLHVESQTGHRLELPHAFLRFFAGTASWVSLNIGHMMASWRKDGLSLHDMIAKTRVCQESGLELRHHVAVGVLLAIHIGSIVITMIMAVHKALGLMASQGLIQPL